jgi:hypothetical protein
MPLLKLSNWQRQQGTDFAQPRAKEEHGVRLVRTSRSKSATAHKSAGLDSSTSSTASSCSGDDGSSPPMLTLSVGIAPPRKSCLTVWTLAESLGDADQVNGTISHCNAVVRRKPKSVTWSQTIQVQHYTTILGDHPCTSRGPPISLGLPVGPPMNVCMAPLGTTTPTVSTLDLLIPADVRERILMKAGYSHSELQNMEFMVLRIKLARRENAKQTLWEVLAKTTAKVSKRLSYSPSQPVS